MGGRDLCGGGGLGGDDEAQLDPPQGTDGEGRCRAHGLARIVRERTRIRIGGDEFAEGPHDEDDDEARNDVGDEHGGSCRLHSGTGADEETGADRRAEAHHHQVARLHPHLETVGRGGGGAGGRGGR